MKKTILLLAILMATTTYSQGIIGGYAGFNMLTINANSPSYDLEKPGTGFEIGASYKYFFTDNFNGLIEFGYANAKLEFKYNMFDFYYFEDTAPQENYTQTLHYLKYTMLGNYNFNDKFGMIAGPNLEAYLNTDGYQPEVEIGMAIGLIRNFENFSLDVRYNLGLTNVLADEYNDADLSVKHNGINIRFTYYFYEF